MTPLPHHFAFSSSDLRFAHHFLRYFTDAQKDEAILRTFRGVSRHFSEVFAELVPGGAGQLIMRTTMDQDQESGGAAAGKSKGGKSKKAATAGELYVVLLLFWFLKICAVSLSLFSSCALISDFHEQMAKMTTRQAPISCCRIASLMTMKMSLAMVLLLEAAVAMTVSCYVFISCARREF